MFGYLPGQLFIPQSTTSVFGPTRDRPPPEGGGFAQVRFRLLNPHPHDLVHGMKFEKLLHPPFTIRTVGEK